MEVIVSYKYSTLDNEPQFGLEFTEDNENLKIYIRWVYYYLGVHLGIAKFPIYSFTIRDGKVIKRYKFCNDAKRQAKLIANIIHKTLKH